MLLWYSHLSNISNQANQAIWDQSPRNFQKEAIPKLIIMRFSSHHPEDLLLVQRTGFGKLVVAQTVRCVEFGVTVIIEAIAADQRSKVDRARNMYGSVLS